MFTPKLFSKSRSLTSLLLAFAVSLPSSLAQSQQDKQKKPDDTIRLETRLVTTDVIVKDKKGKYVTDLKAGDFTVYENGVAQKVELFEPPLGGGSEASKTKTANAATTTVSAINCGAGNRVFLMPMTANAAAALATTYIQAANVTGGQFVVNHANNAQVDRTFGYVVLG